MGSEMCIRDRPYWAKELLVRKYCLLQYMLPCWEYLNNLVRLSTERSLSLKRLRSDWTAPLWTAWTQQGASHRDGSCCMFFHQWLSRGSLDSFGGSSIASSLSWTSGMAADAGSVVFTSASGTSASGRHAVGMDGSANLLAHRASTFLGAPNSGSRLCGRIRSRKTCRSILSSMLQHLSLSGTLSSFFRKVCLPERQGNQERKC